MAFMALKNKKATMSVQSKLGSLLVALFVTLIVLSALVLYRTVVPEFEQLDRSSATLKTQQIYNTLLDELTELVVYSSDWSIWDDTYYFVEDKNEAFIKSSLADEAFVLSDLDFIAFYDMNFNMVWGRWENPAAGHYTDVEPGYIDKQSLSLFHPSIVIAQESQSGFVLTARGPMMVAAYPILQSNGDGPPRGITMTGRFLNDERLKTVADDLTTPFHAIPMGEGAAAPNATLPQAVLDAEPAAGEVTLRSSQSGNRLYSLVTLADINGTPFMKLVHPHELSILDKGKFAVNSALQLMATVFAITLFVVVFSLHRMVITPVAALRERIRTLSQDEALPNLNAPDNQSNELLLALEGFDRMEEAIRQHQSELEDKVKERTEWLVEANKRLEKEVEERRRTELRLQQAKLEAEQASRSKSEFLATVSHEIRTPMNGVAGMASLLLESELTHDQREYARSIQNSADHLLLIINDILNLSKLESGLSPLEEQDFDLKAQLETVLSVQQPKATFKRIALHYESEENVPQFIHADPTRLRQVLFNLIGNAIKFTDEGHVTLRVSLLRHTNQNKPVLLFEVSDTGVGIEPEDQQRIFERFTQVDSTATRRYGGTGLGLSIVERLCTQMGGKIGLESKPGEGSTFWFSVPFKPATGAAVEEEVPESTAKTRTTDETAPLRILVVEDNSVNQLVLEKYFTKRGHTVFLTDNGAEAVELAVERMPDIILMDVQMPDMDGLEATRRIRALESSASDIPVIAVTANAMKGDRERCLEAGMNDYIAKPINFAELSEIIAKHASHPKVLERASNE